MTFPLTEYEARWARVHQAMRRRKLDVAVVWGRSSQGYDRCADVLYLANYYAPEAPPDTAAWHAWGTYAVILAPGETPELVADAADDRSAHIPTDRVYRCDNIIEGVAKRLAERRITGEVGLVGGHILTFNYGRELAGATPEIEWIAADDLVERVRRIKSPRELDRQREGGAVSARALDILMKSLVQGMTERDAVAEAVRELYRGGGTGQFISTNHGDTIAHWCRDPLLGRSADAPVPGDFVRGWMDSVHDGYWFDPGRTAIAGGTGSPAQQALMDDGVRIIEGIMAAIRPGVSTAEIAAAGDRLVREAVGDAQEEEWVFGLYAHGIGLYWEPPHIGKALQHDEETIECNMTMGVEWFLHRDGVGTVGIEENFIVGEHANESLIGLPLQGW